MSENYTRIEGRVKTIEEAVRLLTELALKSDERMDTHDEWINALGAAQADADARIAALADAQIRTEDAIVSLRIEISDLAGVVRQLVNRQNGEGLA